MAPWHTVAMAKTAAAGAGGRSRISVDLPDEVRRRMRIVAARRDLTPQEYVRRAVERQLAEDAPTAIRAEDDPVLADLWDNPTDAVYDEL